MDILKARKKAKAKEKPGGEATAAPAAGVPAPMASPERAPAQAPPPPPEAVREPGAAGKLAGEIAKSPAGLPEEKPAPEPAAIPPEPAEDIEAAISKIESEQAERRKKGGAETEKVQQSVADFVSSFDGQEFEEETSYRHGFVRAEEAEGSQERYLNVRLAREEYGVPLSRVRETIKLPHITEVPLNPAYVAGVFSLRGVIIPVIDLRRRMGLELSDPTRKSRIVVVEVDERLVGLIVDQVRDVVSIRADRIEPPPAVIHGEEAEFLQGIGRTAEATPEERKVLILIDVEAVTRIVREVAA